MKAVGCALSAIALAVSMAASAEPQPRIAARFSGWVVVEIPGQLIDLMDTTGPDPIVAVTCSKGFGAFLMGLRVINQAELVALPGTPMKGVSLRVWADGAQSYEFRPLTSPETPFLAEVWVPRKPELRMWQDELWGIFRTSKIRFSYSTASGVRSVDTTDLNPAAQLFERLCSDLRRD